MVNENVSVWIFSICTFRADENPRIPPGIVGHPSMTSAYTAKPIPLESSSGEGQGRVCWGTVCTKGLRMRLSWGCAVTTPARQGRRTTPESENEGWTAKPP